MIPLSIPHINGNEWKYIKECLNTGWVSSAGKYVEQFENILAKYIGVKYAIAVTNGTAALHLTLLASQVRPGDEVIVPTLTFIAPVNAVSYCGAKPIFMDADKQTFCLDINKLINFIITETVQKKDGFTYNKKTGNCIRAIICVHVFGHPVDMDPIIKICRKRRIQVIEDAAESIGSKYRNKNTGSIGQVNCFSFNGNKIITTGGGGAVTTNSSRIAKQIKHLSTQAKKNDLRYYHDQIGYNYRLTNVLSALGVAQMEVLNKFLAIKRKNAQLYKKSLADTENVKFMWEQPWAKSNFWFYTLKVPPRYKQGLINHLISKKIQVRPIWQLIHTLPMYKTCQAYQISNAQYLHKTCINLPCSVSLTKTQVNTVVKEIKSYINKN